MASFKDRKNRTWEVAITIAAVRRVKSLIGVDLMDLVTAAEGETPLLTRLGTDLALLIDVLFVVCKPQADAANVSDEQFGEALGGGQVADARQAFWEAMSDFFQSLRPETAKAIAKQEALTQRAIELASERIDAIEIEPTIQQAANQPRTGATSGRTSTPSPASSASTRGP